jgi:hypothetical protein
MSGPQRMTRPSAKAKSAASSSIATLARRPRLRKVQADPDAPLGRCRWRGNLPIPKHSHWLVRRLVARLNEEQTTMAEACARAGIARTAIWSWSNLYHPRVDEIEAALNAIGLRLAVEVIPDDEA